MTITDTGLTMREHFEAALAACDAAEQVIVEKGAAATDDDYQAADEASKKMQLAFQAWDNSVKGGAAREAMADQRQIVDGKSFDELASASGVVNPGPGMTVGEAFVKSGAFEELCDRFLKNDGTMSANIGKSRNVDFAVALTNLRNDLRFVEDGDENTFKNLVTGVSGTSGGAFVEPQRLPGYADLSPLRRQTIWELCTKIPLSTDVLEYVELTSVTNNAAPVAEATSSAEIGDGTGGTVLPAAGGVKPESTLAFALQTNAVENIAHWVPITRRAAADAPQLVQIINTFGVRGLQAAAEDQMINGNGTSPNLRGLLNTTNPYNIQTLDVSVAGATRLDAIALAAALIMDGLEGEYMPNGFVVHPLDWFSTDFMLAKDSQGNYLGSGPFAGLDALRQLWGMRAVVSKAVPQDTQVVGDWTEALIGDREQASLYMTDSHSDYFIRNILTMLFEQRLSFGVRVPQAFVSVVA